MCFCKLAFTDRSTGRIDSEFELEFRDTVDYQIIGHGLEGGSRNCIAEDIVRPGHHGFGRYRKMAGNHT